jgi:phosphoenolpyruvate-protein kinase (PTS system EI component)
MLVTRAVLTGRVGSPGVGVGRLLVVSSGPDPVPVGSATSLDPAAERTRLEAALGAAADELEALARRIAVRAGDDIGAIFEAQALFARDPGIVGPALAAVADGSPADLAILSSTDAQASLLAAVDDEYFRARSADVRDVGRRVAGILRGERRSDLWHADGRPAVIVADDLDPSDVANLRPELVAGIALAGGAPTGHVSIVARGLGIPLVLGLGPDASAAPADAQGLVDGRDPRSGRLIIEPDAADLAAIDDAATAPNGAAPAGVALT